MFDYLIDNTLKHNANKGLLVMPGDTEHDPSNYLKRYVQNGDHFLDGISLVPSSFLLLLVRHLLLVAWHLFLVASLLLVAMHGIMGAWVR